MRVTLKNGEVKHELVISFMHEPKIKNSVIKELNDHLESIKDDQSVPAEYIRAGLTDAVKFLKSVMPTQSTALIKRFEAGKKGTELEVLAKGVAKVNFTPEPKTGAVDQFIRRDGRIIALDKAIKALVELPEFEFNGVEDQIVEAYCNLCNYPTMTILDQVDDSITADPLKPVLKFGLFRKYFFIRHNASLANASKDAQTIKGFLAKKA